MSDDASDEELATVSDTSGDAAASAPLFVLRVVKGPDTGKTLVLDWNTTPQVLVGQSRVCELVLSDARVSRRHLSFSPEGRLLRVVDQRSSNGTRLGGARIVEALLAGGEIVELGDSALRVAHAGELPRSSPDSADRFGRVLGASHAMKRLFTLCGRLSARALPVIIEGESGTGKELLAEAIHDAGPRAEGPFIVFDCAAYSEAEQPEALLGTANTVGAFEQANGGTLVIDQVGELGREAQSRLATVIERGELRRPGGAVVHANVRFISLTRDDLDREVQERGFREELLFRLAGARVEVPPLRQRHGDVELLARHFWKLSGGEGEIPKRLVLQLARHDWPGNVRELQHAVSRSTVLGDEAEMARATEHRRTEANDYFEQVFALGLPMQRARQMVIREFERRFVERAVAEYGNVSRAAAASGFTRRYFHMMLAKGKNEP